MTFMDGNDQYGGQSIGCELYMMGKGLLTDVFW